VGDKKTKTHRTGNAHLPDEIHNIISSNTTAGLLVSSFRLFSTGVCRKTRKKVSRVIKDKTNLIGEFALVIDVVTASSHVSFFSTDDRKIKENLTMAV
jgi:hypothetical protein